MSTCRSCGAPVRWARLRDGGRPLIFDAEPVRDGQWRLDGEVAKYIRPGAAGDGFGWAPHWATCPDAESWRDR